jgi:uncharacterized membrane protein HdeD (DUF308 family)
MTATTVRGWDRERFLYGDWSWLIRDWLDVLRILFIAGTIAFAVSGNSDVVALTAASVVLLIARVVNLPRWFDFGLIVAMTLIAYGTALHFYSHWFYYDKVVHSLSPVAYAPVLYIVLVRLGVVPDPGDAIRERRVARISGIFIITFAVGLATGAFYENVEWIEDKFDILGGHFVKGLWDTETDLLSDTTGSLLGATFITVWALRGWSSHRVTVVPAPPPSARAADVADRLRAGRSGTQAWKARLDALPMATQGIVLVAAGALLLALRAPSLRTLGIIVGLALLGYAGTEAILFARNSDRVTRGAQGATVVAAAVAGTLALAWPTISQFALLYAAGVASIVLAAAEVAAVSTKADTRERWLGCAAGVAAFVFGIALLASPHNSLDAVVALFGVYLFVLGGLRLVRAAEAR